MWVMSKAWIKPVELKYMGSKYQGKKKYTNICKPIDIHIYYNKFSKINLKLSLHAAV